MNRKPYIMAAIIYFVVGLGFGAMMSVQMLSNPDNNFVELAQQKAHGQITEEEYQSKIHAIQSSIPPVMHAISLMIVLAFLPTIAMRLKDINVTPMLSLLLPLSSLTAIVTIVIGPVIPHGIMMLLSLVVFIGTVLLAFIPGTKGPNKFGPDPIQRG